MSDARTIIPTHRPSNVSNSPLPASLEQCRAVNHALAPLAELAGRLGWQFERTFFKNGGWDPDGGEFSPRGCFHGFVGEASAAELRQTLDKAAAQVADLWLAVDRPATVADIALYVGMLMACFPDRRTAEERRIFQHLLYSDVSDAKPTLYALQAACARLRRSFRFQQLQIADVIDALAKGKAKSKRVRLLIDAIPHMRCLPMAEEHHWVEEEAGQELRKRIELGWPPDNQFVWKLDDLRRLGLTRLCDGASDHLSLAGLEELQKMEKSEVLARLDRLEAAEAETPGVVAETPKPPTLSEPPVKKPMARARARNRRAKGGQR